MNPTGAWDQEMTETFLRNETIPIRISCRRPAGDLWMLSLWFVYREGALWCATSAAADVVDYLAHDNRVAFEISTNEPPYKGVRGNGTATVTPDEDKQLLRSLSRRYLGGTDSPLAERLLSPQRQEVQIRIDPLQLYTWDFSHRMQGSVPKSN